MKICIYTAVLLISFCITFADKKSPNDPAKSSDIVNSSGQSAQIQVSENVLKNKDSKRFQISNAIFGFKKGKRNIGKELHLTYRFPGKRDLRKTIIWSKNNLVKIFLLMVSIGVILATILYYRKCSKKNRFMTTTRLSVMNRMVQQACRYIEKNYQIADLTVDQMCTDLITGKAYLEALFIKELGMRIEDFIDHARINRVKSILDKDPQSSLSDIASMTGFADVKICSSKFQRVCGVDFETYRNNIISNRSIVQEI